MFRFVPGPEWRDEYERELEKKIKENCGERIPGDLREGRGNSAHSVGKVQIHHFEHRRTALAKSKIHRATITREIPGKPDCIIIDDELMERSDIAAGEKVLIVDITNGERVETFAVRGASGERRDRRVRCGGEAASTRETRSASWRSRGRRKPSERFSNILVDEHNRFVRYLTEMHGDTV